MEMDHIVPRGRGGSDNLDNLQILCRADHAKKHVKPMFAKSLGAGLHSVQPDTQ